MLVKLRSSIRHELMRETLFRGTILGGIGGLMILIAGTTLPSKVLQFWGLPIVIVGFILIAIGLIPYKRLTRLEIKPNELTFDGEFLYFAKNGKSQIKIPVSSIDTLKFIEKKSHYGIGVNLKKPTPEKIVILSPKFPISQFLVHSMEKFGVTLFFPYFTKHSFEEIDLLLNSLDL